MRCVSRVTAPACFGVISMSNFTKKDTFCTQKTGNSVVVFLVHIKDIRGFSFKKEIEKLISKETVASRCWGSET